MVTGHPLFWVSNSETGTVLERGKRRNLGGIRGGDRCLEAACIIILLL